MHKFQLPYTRIFRRFSIYIYQYIYQSINQQTERSSEGDTKCVSKIKQQRNNRLYNWIYTGYCIKKRAHCLSVQSYLYKITRVHSCTPQVCTPQKFVQIPQNTEKSVQIPQPAQIETFQNNILLTCSKRFYKIYKIF